MLVKPYSLQYLKMKSTDEIGSHDSQNELSAAFERWCVISIGDTRSVGRRFVLFECHRAFHLWYNAVFAGISFVLNASRIFAESFVPAWVNSDNSNFWSRIGEFDSAKVTRNLFFPFLSFRERLFGDTNGVSLEMRDCSLRWINLFC